MTETTPPPVGSAWIQILLSVIGLLGGIGGVVAVATVTMRRRRFRADTAALLTDTALTIVRPLRGRVTELELETAQARGRALQAEREISELRVTHREMSALVRRWRAAILAPDATLTAIRTYVRTGRSVRGEEHPSSTFEI
ncbi:hypothetical protein AB0J90_00330 [Micromonospora sp. NPDC049523]|uniref:hypothetical protein n=1 Tax=Micromonospora sp. NPDC049523 TaxID=3155921 RepID=UPI0034212ECA